MQRILSTYRFVNQPLGAGLLAEIAQAGFSAVEVFCASQHFSYRDAQRVRELGDALANTAWGCTRCIHRRTATVLQAGKAAW